VRSSYISEISLNNSAVDLNVVLSLSLNKETPPKLSAVFVRLAILPERTSTPPTYSSVSSSYLTVTFTLKP
jgi:hypothetical protein